MTQEIMEFRQKLYLYCFSIFVLVPLNRTTGSRGYTNKVRLRGLIYKRDIQLGFGMIAQRDVSPG